MMEQVVAPENLRKAWARVKANAGAPGIDGMTVAEFPAFCREHWPAIRSALMKGTYRPAPVRRVLRSRHAHVMDCSSLRAKSPRLSGTARCGPARRGGVAPVN
jgi:hypothetical protein